MQKIQRTLFTRDDGYRDLRLQLAKKLSTIPFERFKKIFEKHLTNIPDDKFNICRLFLIRGEFELENFRSLFKHLLPDRSNCPDDINSRLIDFMRSFGILNSYTYSQESFNHHLNYNPGNTVKMTARYDPNKEQFFSKNRFEFNSYDDELVRHLHAGLNRFYENHGSDDLDEFLVYMDSMINFSKSINNHENADHPIWSEIEHAYSLFATALINYFQDKYIIEEKLEELGHHIIYGVNNYLIGVLTNGNEIYREIISRFKGEKDFTFFNVAYLN